MDKISKGTRSELTGALRARYLRSNRKEKTRILDEFVAITGLHRKHAIRIMSAGEPKPKTGAPHGNRIYQEGSKEALIVVWEAADRICGKRLKAAIPAYLDSMERHGHLKLPGEIREELVKMSAATIDRILMPVREKAGRKRKAKRLKKVAESIRIKTFGDWEDPKPGYLEIDFVVHGGGSMSGQFLHSLAVTDVCTGWVEAIPLLAREQTLVVEGLRRISAQFPVEIHGIDSDNDGAFINETLAKYCEAEGIEFTRCRAYQKNDQSWIEQKNGAVIRKFVGHERYSGIVAGQVMARLFQAVRLYVNYFQPSAKLVNRQRVEGKVKKRYDLPRTPCDRMLNRDDVCDEIKARLRAQRARADPLELLRQIRDCQASLAALTAGESSNGTGGVTIEEFLSGLSEMWRKGEVRPTHRRTTETKERWWRTHADAFRDSWVDVLVWLQNEPDLTARTLMDRLQMKHPGRHSDSQLRTLERRVREWRQSMARELVFGIANETYQVGPVETVTVKSDEESKPFSVVEPLDAGKERREKNRA